MEGQRLGGNHRPGGREGKAASEAAVEGRGPCLETSPNTHTDRHKHTQPTADSPTPRHGLPGWFTWPGPRAPQGPAPESPCGLVSGSPLLPPKAPPTWQSWQD